MDAPVGGSSSSSASCFLLLLLLVLVFFPMGYCVAHAQACFFFGFERPGFLGRRMSAADLCLVSTTRLAETAQASKEYHQLSPVEVVSQDCRTAQAEVKASRPF